MTPGQRVILALGVSAVLAVAAWTGFGIVTIVGFSCPAGNCQVETAASVPSPAAVPVTGNAGNVWVSGITAPVAADVTVNTGSGGWGGGNVDLMLSTIPKDLQVNSAGGSVTVEVPPGSARYPTLSSTAATPAARCRPARAPGPAHGAATSAARYRTTRPPRT